MVRLPHLRPRGRIEREQAAAELAALVVGDRARRLLAGRNAHIEPTVVERRRAGHPGKRKVIDPSSSTATHRCGIDGVDVGRSIADERRQLVDRIVSGPARR